MVIRFKPSGKAGWGIFVAGRKKGSIMRRGSSVSVVFPQPVSIAIVHGVSAFASTLNERA